MIPACASTRRGWHGMAPMGRLAYPRAAGCHRCRRSHSQSASEGVHPRLHLLGHIIDALADKEPLHEVRLVGAAVLHDQVHVEGEVLLRMLHRVEQLAAPRDHRGTDGLHLAALLDEALLVDREVHHGQLLKLLLLALLHQPLRRNAKGLGEPGPGGDEQGRQMTQHLVDAVGVLREGILRVRPDVLRAGHLPAFQKGEELLRGDGPPHRRDLPARQRLQPHREAPNVRDAFRREGGALKERPEVGSASVPGGDGEHAAVERLPHLMLLREVALRQNLRRVADLCRRHRGIDDPLPCAGHVRGVVRQWWRRTIVVQRNLASDTSCMKSRVSASGALESSEGHVCPSQNLSSRERVA
mmetsp:Transcript_106882/g.287770  ORF Transcript_106882/g.287770 Transcript_106882/m.287770 type:complete len:356 (-) Transcript_106882:21-1088(-)